MELQPHQEESAKEFQDSEVNKANPNRNPDGPKHQIQSNSKDNHKENKNLILSPPIRKGMKVLDKAAFAKEIQIPTITIPQNRFPTAIKGLKPFLLKNMKIKPIQETEGQKIVFLNPDLFSDQKEIIEELKPILGDENLTVSYQ